MKYERPLTTAELMTGERMTDDEYRLSMKMWAQDTIQHEAENRKLDTEPLETPASLTDAEVLRLERLDQARRIVAERRAARVADDFNPTDLSGLLTGELVTEPPPDILKFDRGVGLFYRGYTNQLYGDKGSGKTWIGLSAIVEVIEGGGTGWFVDMDHNGKARIVEHLLFLGLSPQYVADPDRFLLWEPTSQEEVNAVREEALMDRPDVVVLDSVGELLPLYGAKTNDADDYTRVHALVIKPMAVAGACVLCIDHPSKGIESRKLGPTGTMAKGRAVRGTSILVDVVRTFKKGQGGQAKLTIDKDAGGDLLMLTGDDNVLGSFYLEPEGGWSFGDQLSVPTKQEKERSSTRARRDGLRDWITDQLTTQAMSGADLIKAADACYPNGRPNGWGNSNIRDMLKAQVEASALEIKEGRYRPC